METSQTQMDAFEKINERRYLASPGLKTHYHYVFPFCKEDNWCKKVLSLLIDHLRHSNSSVPILSVVPNVIIVLGHK